MQILTNSLIRRSKWLSMGDRKTMQFLISIRSQEEWMNQEAKIMRKLKKDC
jgi:hypothetical protein